MELLTSSILTLLALYVLYSEPFKLPTIIKKNKKISYILIIGLYLYYHQSNVVEGNGPPILVDNNHLKDVLAKVALWTLGSFLFGLSAYAAWGDGEVLCFGGILVLWLVYAIFMGKYLDSGWEPTGKQGIALAALIIIVIWICASG